MNLCNDLESKWPLISESKPENEENICVIKIWPIKWIIPLNGIELNHSFHECKVFNFVNINESLDWFGMEMRSRIWIKTQNWKKANAL